jgi:hypothetical protein
MRKVGGGERICLGLAKAPSAVLCQRGDFIRLLTVAGQISVKLSCGITAGSMVAVQTKKRATGVTNRRPGVRIASRRIVCFQLLGAAKKEEAQPASLLDILADVISRCSLANEAARPGCVCQS